MSSSSVRDPTISEPASPRDPKNAIPAVSSSATSSSSSSSSSYGKSSHHAGKFELKSLSIPFGVEKDGVVYYTINVITTGDEKWSCRKRFSAFERLHQVLLELFGHRGFPPGADLPPKKFKFFVSHLSEHFIEERRCLLDSYLSKMSKVPEVVKSDVWLDFLSSDEMQEFQQPPTTKQEVADDSEITGVTIPQTRLMSDHVLYQVDVVNAKKRKTFSKWTVLKRFGQFHELDGLLRADFAEDFATLNQLPASPQRVSKLLYDHLDQHFVEHRRVLLENYMQKLLLMKAVAQNQHFLTFLGVQL